MTKKDRKRKEWILSQAENDKKRKCHSRESGNPGLKEPGSPIKLGMTSYF
jgi:hypothetical protein